MWPLRKLEKYDQPSTFGALYVQSNQSFRPMFLGTSVSHIYIYIFTPSGKRLPNYGKIHHFIAG